MVEPSMPCPSTRDRVIDLYFLEHRAKLIDIAAFLDRVDRAAPDGEGKAEDFRLRAFRQALAILSDGREDRARRILELLSDPTDQPIDAAPTKGAAGAWPGSGR